MPGTKGNKNATKPVHKKAGDYINIRCVGADKEFWRKIALAEGLTLSQWIIKTLNEKKGDFHDIHNRL